MIRRNGLVAYWLLFAVYTLYAAKHPGLVSDSAAVPYPWRGVVTTWIILAVATGILYAILRPPTFRGQGARLGLALLYSLVLILLAFVTFVTDMPGYVYVPGFFALSTFAALLLLAVGTAAFRLLRPAGPHSQPPAA
jgi:hypothetical protein